ncbi:hypothetical protein I4U23_015307 [Adineta vaga]|nr:hypothetical protein I4U23_015307 [Adineta vaga]
MVNIDRLFKELKEQIVNQATLITRTGDRIDALLQDKSKRIQDYIQLAVREQIIKVAANNVINAKRDQVTTLIANHFQVQRGQRKNELLTVAQRHVLNELSIDVLQKTNLFNVFFDNLITLPLRCTRFWRSLPIRLSSYRKDIYNRFIDTQIKKGDDDDAYKLLDAMDTYATLSNETGRHKLADHYLTELSEKIKKQKDTFNHNLYSWVEEQRKLFNKNTKKNYIYIQKHLADQHTRYNMISNFSGTFAKIECQLLAAIELHKRNGIRPVLGDELGRSSLYGVYEAQWHTDNNLAVKKLLRPLVNDDKMVALEAHLHRAATLLYIDHIVPLLYTYENNLDDNRRELWLIMPKYPMSLQQYLIRHMAHIEFTRVVNFALTVATTLAELHRREMVHRDLKASNVMLDENEQCYLIDFGTAKFGFTGNTILGTAPIPPEIIARQSIQDTSFATYDGTAADIYSFGHFLYEMLPKSNYERLDVVKEKQLDDLFRSNPKLDEYTKPYEDLIRRCLSYNPNDRPDAIQLVSDLKTIEQKTETKLCMMCEDRLRAVRFTPCGHKVSCAQCWESHSRPSVGNTKCIICQRIVRNHIQDDINATYVPQLNSVIITTL